MAGVDSLAEENGDARPSASVLLNGLRVLESFSITEPVLGVTEIARKVDLHKSSVSRILATLEKAGYVERDNSTGRFRLGLGLIALTGPLLANLDVRRVAQPELEELTRRTGETSALMVWNGHESVVVEQVQSPQQVKHTASVGTRYDTYQSSSVQVFLSEMPRAEVQRLFDRRLLVGPDDTQAVHAYLEELDRARDQGYAVNDGRTSIEEVGICAPVHDHRGVLVAAILLSAPRFRVPPTMLEPIGRTVAETARHVSQRLGGGTSSPSS
ncbi:IclR family transcriptional regulator [Mycolicibacterium mageritense DSM 44476 = CIP 104973]|uniref:Glycerol operon regulatory protein n=1 Tax=Mycolicibacterium mageritense TaxID=53462 RepID=A0AAI8TXT0_MYCME|nr:IclR family transcriptional regulator [Mycolicibacterium mageritense]MBN3459145.1 IclR family transcriptional regulator [Mycobacterium sp. DSM 3803]MCC9183030.1 IclR family transcriptional regulator [Mycolicibacterium mageritense]TXI64647.1 MAG: IclR family transcriptional regulator [Mycolicibacterium mageritense]CDO19635.1 regulatory proteins IclR [Mycolicibacterium mageritense DSM 44476 = CIP 104973]BBX35860.1 IclR family transcriptional regulator [Mycolicibacterium mageritense]